MRKYINLRANLALVLTFVFLANTLGPLPCSQAQDDSLLLVQQSRGLNLPEPGVMVGLSPEFNPPILKGIKVHPGNPFHFDFILDKGDNKLNNEQIKDESSRLIKYFLASLTIPENDLWVNLSPYEKNRIVPKSFGQTEMGRDLLAEDYMLKQITASLIYPEGEVGKKFWKRIYEEAFNKFGTTNIPVNTFNKVWIIPEKAVVYENAKAGTAYVVESKLKVMLEQDYLALRSNSNVGTELVSARSIGRTQGLPLQKSINALSSQIIRQIVIPELTKEVNQDKNFTQLRQVYNSLILATWYKKKIKDSILEQVYADQKKVAGVNIDDPQETQRIYQRYLQAFKKGAYNYIKEDVDPATQETVPRKYFSGGTDLNLAATLRFVNGFNPAQIAEPSLLKVTVDLAMDTRPPGHMIFITNNTLIDTQKLILRDKNTIGLNKMDIGHNIKRLVEEYQKTPFRTAELPSRDEFNREVQVDTYRLDHYETPFGEIRVHHYINNFFVLFSMEYEIPSLGLRMYADSEDELYQILQKFDGDEWEMTKQDDFPKPISRKNWKQWRTPRNLDYLEYQNSIHPAVVNVVQAVIARMAGNKKNIHVLDIFSGDGHFIDLLKANMAKVLKTVHLSYALVDGDVASQRKAVQLFKGSNDTFVYPTMDITGINNWQFLKNKPDIITALGGLNAEVISQTEAKVLSQQLYALLPQGGFLVLTGKTLPLLQRSDFEQIGFQVLNQNMTLNNKRYALYILKKPDSAMTGQVYDDLAFEGHYLLSNERPGKVGSINRDDSLAISRILRSGGFIDENGIPTEKFDPDIQINAFDEWGEDKGSDGMPLPEIMGLPRRFSMLYTDIVSILRERLRLKEMPNDRPFEDQLENIHNEKDIDIGIAGQMVWPVLVQSSQYETYFLVALRHPFQSEIQNTSENRLHYDIYIKSLSKFQKQGMGRDDYRGHVEFVVDHQNNLIDFENPIYSRFYESYPWLKDFIIQKLTSLKGRSLSAGSNYFTVSFSNALQEEPERVVFHQSTILDDEQLAKLINDTKSYSVPVQYRFEDSEIVRLKNWLTDPQLQDLLPDPMLFKKFWGYMCYKYGHDAQQEIKIREWYQIISVRWGIPYEVVSHLVEYFVKYASNPKNISENVLAAFMTALLPEYQQNWGRKRQFNYVIDRSGDFNSYLKQATENIRKAREFSTVFGFKNGKDIVRADIQGSNYFLLVRQGSWEDPFGLELLLGKKGNSKNPFAGKFCKVGMDTDGEHTLRIINTQGVKREADQSDFIAEFTQTMGIKPTHLLYLLAVELADRFAMSDFVAVKSEFLPHKPEYLDVIPLYKQFGFNKEDKLGYTRPTVVLKERWRLKLQKNLKQNDTFIKTRAALLSLLSTSSATLEAQGRVDGAMKATDVAAPQKMQSLYQEFFPDQYKPMNIEHFAYDLAVQGFIKRRSRGSVVYLGSGVDITHVLLTTNGVEFDMVDQNVISYEEFINYDWGAELDSQKEYISKKKNRGNGPFDLIQNHFGASLVAELKSLGISKENLTIERIDSGFRIIFKKEFPGEFKAQKYTFNFINGDVATFQSQKQYDILFQKAGWSPFFENSPRILSSKVIKRTIPFMKPGAFMVVNPYDFDEHEQEHYMGRIFNLGKGQGVAYRPVKLPSSVLELERNLSYGDREGYGSRLEVFRKVRVNQAMKAVNGGIDLTPANMNLQTQNPGGAIKLHMDAAMLQQLQNAPGFVPVIISVEPMTDLRRFLGLTDSPLDIVST